MKVLVANGKARKEIAQSHCGAYLACTAFRARERAVAVVDQLRAHELLCRARLNDHGGRDGAQRAQRLAAEAKGREAREVVKGRQLGRRVLARQRRIVLGFDARAVIDDLERIKPTLLEPHLNLARARIERVLHELLERRGRVQDDLPRADFVHRGRVDGLDVARRRRHFNRWWGQRVLSPAPHPRCRAHVPLSKKAPPFKPLPPKRAEEISTKPARFSSLLIPLNTGFLLPQAEVAASAAAAAMERTGGQEGARQEGTCEQGARELCCLQDDTVQVGVPGEGKHRAGCSQRGVSCRRSRTGAGDQGEEAAPDADGCWWCAGSETGNAGSR